MSSGYVLVKAPSADTTPKWQAIRQRLPPTIRDVPTPAGDLTSDSIGPSAMTLLSWRKCAGEGLACGAPFAF